MSWYRLPLCLLGKHERSRGAAHESGDHLESVCRHCGVPMEKHHQVWRVKR